MRGERAERAERVERVERVDDNAPTRDLHGRFVGWRARTDPIPFDRG
jgi:hypothetical protein